jgi:hypothetical protein
MFVATYYYMAFVQTLLHRFFGHKDRIHPIYQTHAKGHHAKYPPNRLITDVWVDSERHVMWYFAIPLIPGSLVMWYFFGPWLFVSHVASLAFTFWSHIYLHKQYHIRGTWWERFKWFQKKRELHFIHHRHAMANFAVVEFWLDRILGTRIDHLPQDVIPKDEEVASLDLL